MAQLTGLTVTTTGNLTLPSGTSANRPSLQSYTAVRWVNTGTQAVSVLTGSATTTTTSWTCPTGVTSIEVLVVAGGGGTGYSEYHNGGGGAGGLIYNSNFPVTPGTTYTVTVGAGGTGGTSNSSGNQTNGGNSIFGSLTALGGGKGGQHSSHPGGNGGSGGGGAENGGVASHVAGTGTPGQGHPGAPGFSGGQGAGGGGGAGGAGQVGVLNSRGGNGGIGLNFSISGTPTWYAGGGGGSNYYGTTTSSGGLGGGGIGWWNNVSVGSNGAAGSSNGTPSTGGGAGAYERADLRAGAVGGSGVVIIRYALATTTTQPFGQTRFSTTSNTLETFTTKNNWNSANGAILILDPGNAACYPGSGSTLTDLSGLNNNATMVASPTYTSGNGGYFTFNGTSQYLRVPMSDSMDTCQTGITMISWIYPTAWNSGMAWNNHIQGATSIGPVSGAIQNIGASGNLNIQTRINNTCCQTLSMSATATLNTWFQYVSIWDGGCLRVYMNGVLQNIGQPTYGTLNMINDMFFGVNADTFIINGTTVNMYTGRLGWTAIYNCGLTADEVNLNFQTYRSRYGI